MNGAALCKAAYLLSCPFGQRAARMCQYRQRHPLSTPACPSQAAQQKVWTHDEVFYLFYAMFEHVQQPPHLLPILASPRIAERSTAEASFATCILCSAGAVMLPYRLLLKLPFLGLIGGGSGCP